MEKKDKIPGINEPSLEILLENQEARLSALEESSRKKFFKSATEMASASALLLGLVLSSISLYDAAVTKPEAERISRVTQFNQAVNSAAKLRQDVLQSQAQTTDPKLQLIISAGAVSQISNNISIARAILRDMSDQDVGISQLIVLITESINVGDMESAKSFTIRAVNKGDVTPYLRSEAKRFEGRLLFMNGEQIQGRQAFLDAVDALGRSPNAAAARAYDLGDLVLLEYTFGDCEHFSLDIQKFLGEVKKPQVLADARSQLLTTVRSGLAQAMGRECPIPQEDVLNPAAGVTPPAASVLPAIHSR
jgi:hypothetical protein